MERVTLVYTNGRPRRLKATHAVTVLLSDRKVHIGLFGAAKKLGGSVTVETDEHITIQQSEILGYHIRRKDDSIEAKCLVPSRKKEFVAALGNKVA